MGKAKGLPPKRAKFVREYLIDFNATQAAIRAGYSEKTARSQGQRLLTNADIAQAVSTGFIEQAERAQVTADEVLKRAWDIALSSERDRVSALAICAKRFPEFNRTESTVTAKRSIEEMTDEELVALTSRQSSHESMH